MQRHEQASADQKVSIFFTLVGSWPQPELIDSRQVNDLPVFYLLMTGMA
jgi:hypothetical protein